MFYLTKNGNGISDGSFVPDGWVACTQAQYENASNWQIEASQIVPNKNLLLNAQVVQNSVLSSACEAQILSGFTSSTLGSAYTYASGDIDQRNIVQSAQSSKGGLLACQNAASVWGIEPHTQDQSQQALEDFVAARDATRLKLAGLITQVNAATTVEEVQSIIW